MIKSIIVKDIELHGELKKLIEAGAIIRHVAPKSEGYYIGYTLD